MKPVIPPDHAFAVAGRVPAAVGAVLAEARRIRDGWAQALEAARLEARTQASAEHHAHLRRGLRALHRWAEAERARLQTEARALAVALARRLVAVPLDLPTLTPLLTSGRWLVVRLHPDDAQALGSAPEGIEIIADSSLALGDVVLEGPAGRVDGRAATRLNRLVAGP